MASPRARCREHVDQCQCWTDIATAHYTVRRRSYCSGTATNRNCHQTVEETESTPKRVVRPTQQAATHKALAFPGLRAQARKSSWVLPAVCEKCFAVFVNTRSSGIRGAEGALEGEDFLQQQWILIFTTLGRCFLVMANINVFLLICSVRKISVTSYYTYYINCTYFCPITINRLLISLHELNGLFLATEE